MLDPLTVVALTVWGEARGEPPQGQLAVACVIRNRMMREPWTARDPGGVCLQRKQFSCWNQNDPNGGAMLRALVDGALDDQLAIARNVFLRGQPDVTGGATHYHAKSITPSWAASLRKTVTIGNHVFYVERS